MRARRTAAACSSGPGRCSRCSPSVVAARRGRRVMKRGALLRHARHDRIDVGAVAAGHAAMIRTRVSRPRDRPTRYPDHPVARSLPSAVSSLCSNS